MTNGVVPTNVPDDSPTGPGHGGVMALLAGPLLFIGCLLLPMPELSWEGKAVLPTTGMQVALGLALWMAVWWVTEAVHLAATSLLPLLVLPLGGALGARDVSGQYFDDIIVLFLGGFCLALAMERTGLHHHIASWSLRAFGSRPRQVVLGLLAATAATSMWVSNTATALAFLPVALTLASAAGSDTPDGKRFGSACVLAVAFGASLGGIGTLIGTPPNAILLGNYNRVFASEIAAGTVPELTFGRWMMIGVPLILVLVPAAWLILTRVVPGVPRSFPETTSARLAAAAGNRSNLTRDQRIVGLVFLLTAFAWITRGSITIGSAHIPLTGWGDHFVSAAGKAMVSDGTVAIAAAVILLALPSRGPARGTLLPWSWAAGKLPWAALLLFGGGLALAKSFEATGFDRYMLAAFGQLGELPVWLLVLAVAVAMTVLSEIASNTAAAALALPLLASLALAVGISPTVLLVTGTLGASCGYALPAATPPNTVAYATGAVSMKQLAASGVILDVVAILVVTVGVMWLVPAVLG